MCRIDLGLEGFELLSGLGEIDHLTLVQKVEDLPGEHEQPAENLKDRDDHLLAGGVEVIERMTAMTTDMAMIDQPAFGSAKNEFQSATASAPKAAVRADIMFLLLVAGVTGVVSRDALDVFR